MFTYHGNNSQLREQIERCAKNAEKAYELLLGSERLARIEGLEKVLLTKDAFVPLEKTGIKYFIDGAFKNGNPVNIKAAPEISILSNDGFLDYLHEYHHFIFFALQRFPAAVAIDTVMHFNFDEFNIIG